MPDSRAAVAARVGSAARRGLDHLLWSAYSRVYDGLLDFGPYRSLLRRVADDADLDSAHALLDVGCGTGNLLALCATEHPDLELTGIDASAAMLRRAPAKLQAHRQVVRLVHDDALRGLRAEPPGSVDRISAVNVLYTLDDRGAFWRETARVLTADGLAVVTTSTRGGSASIVREHLDHAPFHTLLRPRLVAVFVIDAIISLLARAEHFAFASEGALIAEAEANGVEVLRTARGYGDVNVIITARVDPAADTGPDLQKPS